ncbi:MAG: aminopeptidase [Nitrospirota bacterium]|nr:aminopeptidase [Nitrospirota bacterium]
MTKTLRNIFSVNLNVKKSESVLVFTDMPFKKEFIEDADRCRRERLRDIAILTAETGKGFCKRILYHEYPATGSHGAEPPQKLWAMAFGEKTFNELKAQKLLHPLIKKKADDSDMRSAEEIIARYKKHAVNVVVALSNYSTSHTRFRDFLTRLCKTRYASMPLFDAAMLEGAMNVNWRLIDKRTRSIARIVNKAEAVEIKTPNGTSISFSKKGRKAGADTGILTAPGAFGNLPAGEVYLAPVEGTAEGRLVLEFAPTRQLKSPVALTVKNGFVEEVSGDDEYAGYLRAKLSERRENANIAELGIGTNDMAKRPDNILESEKILGTIHIALGDNSSFGGNVCTPFHQDFVFFKPTLTLIDKNGKKALLMKDGKFTISSFRT